MAINIITQPGETNPQTADWVLFINNIIMKTKGLNAVSITEGFTTTEPMIEQGSTFEVGDSFYYLDEDESITGWSSLGNVGCWIYTNGLTFWYSASAPTFDYNKYGWYSGTSRALFSLEKGGASLYKYKTRLPAAPEDINARFGSIDIKRDMIVANELYGGDIDTGAITVSDYGESNGGVMIITTATIGTAQFSGSGGGVVNGTLNVTGTVQTGPSFVSNVWNAANRITSSTWVNPTETVAFGYYVLKFTGGSYLQMWSGSSWVYMGTPPFIMGNPSHYRITAPVSGDIYWGYYA